MIRKLYNALNNTMHVDIYVIVTAHKLKMGCITISDKKIYCNNVQYNNNLKSIKYIIKNVFDIDFNYLYYKAY